MSLKPLLVFALVIAAMGVAVFMARSLPNFSDFSFFSLPLRPSEKPAPPQRVTSSPLHTGASKINASEPERISKTEISKEEIDPRASIATSSIPFGFTREKLSLKFRKLRIISINHTPSSSNAESITLMASLNPGETLKVSGWRVVTKTHPFVIPRIPLTYDPWGALSPEDIILKNGDVLSIYGSPPKLGTGFRLNTCVGYLEALNLDIRPPLPRTCPRLYDDVAELSRFSSKCQDYIRSLHSCALPSDSPSVPQEDYACREFLRSINYGSCYNTHKNDANFLLGEVRIWLGSPFQDFHFLDERHDRILLFDEEDLLVDEYAY